MNISLASFHLSKQVASRRLFSISSSGWVAMDRASSNRPARKLMPNQSIRSVQKNPPKQSTSASHPCTDLSPLFIDWPSIDSEVAKNILKTLLELLEPPSESVDKLDTICSASAQKKQRLEPSEIGLEATASQEARSLIAGRSIGIQAQLGTASEPTPCGGLASANPQSGEVPTRKRIPPRRLKVIRAHTQEHFAIGLNSVTRHLEEIIAIVSRFPRPPREPAPCDDSSKLVKGDSTADDVPPTISDTIKQVQRPRHHQVPCLPPDFLRMVFTCRSDLDDTSLIDLLPALIEQANKMIVPLFGEEKSIRLAELPAGSQEKLTKKLGIRRATTMGALASAPGIDKILKVSDTACTARPPVK